MFFEQRMANVPHHRHSELHTHSMLTYIATVTFIAGLCTVSRLDTLEKEVVHLKTREQQMATIYERRISELENKADIAYLPTSTNLTAEMPLELNTSKLIKLITDKKGETLAVYSNSKTNYLGNINDRSLSAQLWTQSIPGEYVEKLPKIGE